MPKRTHPTPSSIIDILPILPQVSTRLFAHSSDIQQETITVFTVSTSIQLSIGFLPLHCAFHVTLESSRYHNYLSTQAS